MNDIYSGKANCDVAIYGSSRAWVNFNTKIIEDSLKVHAYNFGIDGHNFWLQYLRHLEFTKYNQKPKEIILAVDIFTLEKRKDLYNESQFLPYMLWNKNIWKYTSSYIGFDQIDYLIPLVRYRGKFSALRTAFKNISMRGKVKTYRYKGFAGMNRSWNSDYDEAKATKGTYTAKIDEQTVLLFEKFVQECKESGIKLILVYTPEFIEGQGFVTNKSEIIRIYREFSLKYNIPFWDYSNDKICFDKQLFYNTTHLNKEGANLFTSELVSKLKKENALDSLFFAHQ